MARPREFDEAAVLDAAIGCFWNRGYEATSVRDLATEMRITGASLYNAFGDKRSLYEKALRTYVERRVINRMRRCEGLAPRAAIETFFGEIVDHSLTDEERKGCMLVNAALAGLPGDPAFGAYVAEALGEIESFFRRMAERGQADGSISAASAPEDIARLLLGALMGMRVLARSRPERALLEGLLRAALVTLDRSPGTQP
ncbi:TetR/AcrR family transcriptional regulator, transcriptional repressor for nem operon [Bosea sp. CRIB-10]|uniref:TetR/AcrR family transcriptional regulator n=1 Tax=Bosea sp. CRIB-10 TaxID=378404 RepID=UPI0008E69F24|nr:TetR/AcrR family transcriptional regulator [Bosea sp. CRIB-10]SFD52623.1 TetR/AcrR family transcriptional regulator, transcriptional repressor for nem operon [Bosea sp. CRIB-10]